MSSSREYGGSESVSFWPGRSSADGSLVIVLGGIGGVSPSRSASALRHFASSHTWVLNTSLIGANAPTASP